MGIARICVALLALVVLSCAQTTDAPKGNVNIAYVENKAALTGKKIDCTIYINDDPNASAPGGSETVLTEVTTAAKLIATVCFLKFN